MEFARGRGIDAVIAIVAPENTPSARVAEKAGLVLWQRTDYHGRPHLIYRADLRASEAAS
jgi:RimJ/RimL family protein N-acetyltransferase